MIRRGIRIEPDIKCSCRKSKVTFFLPIKRLQSSSDSPKDRKIVEGTILKDINDKPINGYPHVVGNCQECKLEHEARLKIKDGVCMGIMTNTIVARTEEEKKAIKNITGR